MKGESIHVQLATAAIEAYVKRREVIRPSPEALAALSERAACFVSLKENGDLRGCIGTIEPTQPTLAEEIIQNAISACSRDPRFPPVEPEELDLITCSVDVLSPPEPVDDISELDPKRYGVIVERGFARGLLLPDLEGIDTVEEQLAIACRKAGISPNEPFSIKRFEVKRYH